MTEKELLDRVEETRRLSESSRQAYLSAVLAAHKAGISNVRIAGRAGISETAIRQMIKRAEKK